MSTRTFILALTGSAFIVAACSSDGTSIVEVKNTAERVASTLLTATPPGTVSDLSAFAIASTSVTLSFTQVDDGTGQPASYDVRYAVAPTSWGSATSTASGTCTTPVAGTAIGSRVTCAVLGLSPSKNYNFQLIAFRGTLNINAVFGGV